MKKTIIAMALAGVFAVQASAQDNNCPNGRQVCPEGNAAACAATDNRASDKMYRPQKFTDFAFEGILLDMGQQARMDSLNAAMAPKQCADSACVNKDCKAKGRKGHGRMDRREYVKKVKEILTPDQYTVFLENIVMMPDQMRGGRDMKGHHGDMRSRRPDGPKGKELKAVRDGKRQKDMKARVENNKAKDNTKK
ncbi:MAG: hypothetical protein NC241_01450 [Bacteroides sp.]|nr:hypothetical protein [Bacteroides sp.]MCM1458021.1 hypothetical protein [Lachnoclostridium sp.]